MRRRPTERALLLLLGESLLAILASLLAVSIRALFPNGPDPWTSFWLMVLETCTIYPLTLWLFSLYDLQRIANTTDEFPLLIVACVFADLLLAGSTYFTAFKLSRIAVVLFYALQFGLIASERLLLRHWKPQSQEAPLTRRAVLLGDEQVATKVRDWLALTANEQVKLVGYLGCEPVQRRIDEASVPCLGRWEETEGVVQQLGVDDVLLAVSADAHLELRTGLEHLLRRGRTLWIVPDDSSPVLYGTRWARTGAVLALNFKLLPMSSIQYATKRTSDLLLGFPLLLVATPLMALIALAIKLDSGGPVLIRQQRVGEAGRMFYMYKFRSMISNADEHLLQYWRSGNLAVNHKRDNDPRVTRVGRFIRRTSLDELPNLINVLKGEMSLVGPRPELPLLVERYEVWQHQRFAVPQGMTGWWQVNGRSNRPMHLHTEDDLYYVRHYSLWLDLQILAKTIWVVLRGEGAY